MADKPVDPAGEPQVVEWDDLPLGDPRAQINVDTDPDVEAVHPAVQNEEVETETAAPAEDNWKGGCVTVVLTIIMIAGACVVWFAEGFIWKLAGCVVPVAITLIAIVGWMALKPSTTEWDDEGETDDEEDEDEAEEA